MFLHAIHCHQILRRRNTKVTYHVFQRMNEPTNQPTSNLSEELEQINVSGSTENSDTKTPPKIAETVKTAKNAEEEQANNIKDIVK